MSRVVRAGLVLLSGLHLIFHLRGHGGLTGIDLGLSLTSLTLGVLAPGALLMLNHRRPA